MLASQVATQAQHSPEHTGNSQPCAIPTSVVDSTEYLRKASGEVLLRDAKSDRDRTRTPEEIMSWLQLVLHSHQELEPWKEEVLPLWLTLETALPAKADKKGSPLADWADKKNVWCSSFDVRWRMERSRKCRAVFPVRCRLSSPSAFPARWR